MPGNKWQHQDSSSNSKPSFFTGQFFEVVGVLASTNFGCMCLPFAVKMIDGFKHHNRDNSTLKTRSSDFLQELPIEGSIVVADAWYAAKPFLEAIFNSNSILVTRVARSAVGYFSPTTPQKRGRGRPSKYGEALKLMSLFLNQNLITVTLKGMDNSKREVKYWTQNLLWKSAHEMVKFVGCEMNGKKIILLSTDLQLSAEDIIQCYLYRTSIETTFWYSTQILFNWCYRFWTKLNIVSLAKYRNCNLHLATKGERNKYWQKVSSYESFLLIGFFVQAFLVYLIQEKPQYFQRQGL
jgi:hypothetical protein